MSESTTSIFELPTADPGIHLGIQEKSGPGPGPTTPSQSVPSLPNSLTLDQTTINQIVSGLQQASTTGATMLPSRDIPQSVEHLSKDPAVQANYIPRGRKEEIEDYIEDDEEEEVDEMIRKNNKKVRRSELVDRIYDIIQTPLLLAVLYFLFQLPVIRKWFFRFVPALFLKDGNPNLYGLLVMSESFGFSYSFLDKALNQIDRF
jgi:hypothetical protein